MTGEICDNRPRSMCEVELDVPTACAGSPASESNCPIVFFLHGAGGIIGPYKFETNLHNGQNNYIGVYPQGESFGWLTGPKADTECDWDDLSCTQDPDEGDYIAAIISKLRAIGGNGNIYAIGVSNGAALAYRLASNAGDALPFKGIVAVVSQMLRSPSQSGGGLYNYNQPSKGRSNQGISVLQILGTQDFVPYNGGTSIVFEGVDDFKLYPALDSMKAWADHNDCSGDHTETDIPASFEADSPIQVSSVRKYDYSYGCPSGEILEHYRVEAGHGAGDVTIDGVPFMNNFPYDFINRVEDTLNNSPPSTSSPVTSPTLSTSSPVVAPSPTPNECENDPSWLGKFSQSFEPHDCEFVALDPEERCDWVDSKGINAHIGCPDACDADCKVLQCEDSPLSFKQWKKWRRCGWAAKKKTKRCSKKNVASQCPMTCGRVELCSEDSLKKFKVMFKGIQRETKCAWVKRNPNVRCNIEGVCKTCRATCSICEPTLKKRTYRPQDKSQNRRLTRNC